MKLAAWRSQSVFHAAATAPMLLGGASSAASPPDSAWPCPSPAAARRALRASFGGRLTSLSGFGSPTAERRAFRVSRGRSTAAPRRRPSDSPFLRRRWRGGGGAAAAPRRTNASSTMRYVHGGASGVIGGSTAGGDDLRGVARGVCRMRGCRWWPPSGASQFKRCGDSSPTPSCGCRDTRPSPTASRRTARWRRAGGRRTRLSSSSVRTAGPRPAARAAAARAPHERGGRGRPASRQPSRQRAHIADLTAALNLYRLHGRLPRVVVQPSTHKGDALRYCDQPPRSPAAGLPRAPPVGRRGRRRRRRRRRRRLRRRAAARCGRNAQRAPTPLTNLDDDSGRGSDAPIDSFCVVTVGVPAAHAMGFKEGGVWQLQQRKARIETELREETRDEAR